MYFYLDEFHSSKPRGVEYKSNMPGASIVIGMLPGDTFDFTSKNYVNCTLVIEHSGSVKRSSCALSVGKDWEDEYRIHHTTGGAPLAIKIERYKNYTNQQTIEFKANMNYSPDGQFVKKLGNIAVEYIVKLYSTNYRFDLPAVLFIDGKKQFFKYSYVTYPSTKRISKLTFVGLTDNFQEVKELQSILSEMGYHYY